MRVHACVRACVRCIVSSGEVVYGIGGIVVRRRMKRQQPADFVRIGDDPGNDADSEPTIDAADHDIVELMVEGYCSLVPSQFLSCNVQSQWADQGALARRSYLHRLEGLVEDAVELRQNMHDRDRLLEICLDSTRNQLHRFELQLATATIALTTSGVVAGVFGMNLVTGLEDHPSAFVAAVGATSVLSVLLHFSLWRLGGRIVLPLNENMAQIHAIRRVLENFDAIEMIMHKRPLTSKTTREELHSLMHKTFANISDDVRRAAHVMPSLYATCHARVAALACAFVRQDVDIIYDMYDKDNDGVLTLGEFFQHSDREARHGGGRHHHLRLLHNPNRPGRRSV